MSPGWVKLITGQGWGVPTHAFSPTLMPHPQVCDGATGKSNRADILSVQFSYW